MSTVKKKRVLVTGAAGFIGFHLVRRLLSGGCQVVGVDSLSDYYDPQLKRDRLAQVAGMQSFTFEKLDLADREMTATLFERGHFDYVVHLAAQAGVRHSIKNPHSYIDSNLVAFTNVLEGCRHADSVEHLVFASSSSVYGANEKVPYSTGDNVDHPVSLYAATKKSGELLAHSYAHLYDLPVTGLRFFTVYGPWGRPDMAYFLFADAITRGKPIKIFGHGEMRRDFTYVGDVAEGVTRALRHLPRRYKPGREAHESMSSGVTTAGPGHSKAPYRIYNIGNGSPVGLMRFVEVLEEALGREAEKEFLPMQPGDMRVTYADSSALMREVGYAPGTSLEEGIGRFVDWYQAYQTADRKTGE